MCTVTFLPKEKYGYILTSNRDEKVDRPAAMIPEILKAGDQKLLMPADGLHGGTWISCSDNGRTLCLLNGAFEKHVSTPPYKKSRGLVLLDAFEYLDAQDFIFRYDLSGIEPFTLIFIHQNNLNEIRWDGTRCYVKNLDRSKPYIWSSATLYSSAIIEQRKQWFNEWQELNKEHTVQSILNFHEFAGTGDIENNIKMNRNDVLKTVSITSVNTLEENIEMHYRDLMSGKDSTTSISIKSKMLNEITAK